VNSVRPSVRNFYRVQTRKDGKLRKVKSSFPPKNETGRGVPGQLYQQYRGFLQRIRKKRYTYEGGGDLRDEFLERIVY